MPKSEANRKKGFEHYQTLGTSTFGRLSFSSSQVPLSSNEDHELEENFISHGVHADIKDEIDAPPYESRNGKRPCTPSNMRGEKKKE